MKSYHLSNSQNRIYILDKSGSLGTTYNILHYLEIKEDVNIARLWSSFDEIIKRHEIFRTSFDQNRETGEIVQVVHESISYDKEFEEIKELEFEKKLKDFVSPFNLQQPPLFKVKIFRQKNTCLFALNIHHIIFDDISAFVFNSELSKLYKGDVLSAPEYQYTDYVKWQDEFKGTQEYQRQEKYWLTKLSGELPQMEFPLDHRRGNEFSYKGDTLISCIEGDLFKKIEKIKTELSSTYHKICLAAFVILLSKYTGEENIIVGIPASGRTTTISKLLMGSFVNTLPLINSVSHNKTIREIVREVDLEIKEIIQNQDYQLDNLVKKLDVSRGKNRNILFDTMFNLVQMDSTEIFTPKRINITNGTQFDLIFQGFNEGNRIVFEIQFKTELFERQTIERLVAHYENILKSISENVDQKIEDLSLLTPSEYQTIVYEWNKTEAPYPKDKTIHQLFEEQVERTPNNIALVFENKQLTYLELSRNTNYLANILRGLGIGRDDIVPIIVERSANIIIGALSIIKAGGCYTYIDPKYPIDRKKFIVNDYKAKVILSDARNYMTVPSSQFLKNTLVFEEVLKEAELSEKKPISNINNPSDLFAIITTSGSTGLPKGSMIEHRNFANFATYYNKLTGTDEYSNIASYASFNFDVSVATNFAPILCGAAVHIVPEKARYDIHELHDLFVKNKINITFLPTAIGEMYIMVAE